VAADRIALLGQRYDAKRLFLLPVREADESWAGDLARCFGPEPSEHSHRLPCAVLGAGWVDPGASPVAVALVPKTVRERDLEPMSALLEGLGWPMLGVVTYDPARRRLWRRRPARAPRQEGVRRQPTYAGDREAAPSESVRVPDGPVERGLPQEVFHR
jgi:hypothetical protein